MLSGVLEFCKFVFRRGFKESQLNPPYMEEEMDVVMYLPIFQTYWAHLET